MNILLVDDENALLEILGTALRASGHDVSTATDGAGALHAMQARSFDAMVCDVRMPNVDGLAVLKHAQSHAPATRVILMTAYATVPGAVSALQHGAVDYLRKPFMVEELLQRLETISTSQAVKSELVRGRADPLYAEPVGRSAAMQRGHSMVEKFLPTDESELTAGEPKMDGVVDRHTPQPLVEAMREFEKEYLERALKIAGGSKVRAAALLGISRKSLWAKLKRYRGAEAPDPTEE